MRARFEKVAVEPNRSFRAEAQRLARFDAPWHFHPEIELTLIVKSRGRRFVGDSIEAFAEGDLVLLGPDLPHFWQNEEPRPAGRQAHSVVVQFRPDFMGTGAWEMPEIQSVHRLLGRAGRGLQFTGRTAREAAATMKELPSLSGMAGLVRLLELLEKLAWARGVRNLTSVSYAPVLNRRTEQRLARVYAYAAAHFQETVTLPELAQAAAMSPAAFSRYFKRATGRAPSDFLNDLRIEQACLLLRESGRSITEIAGHAGFAALTNFNRRFRERTGVTPREYRRSFA